MATIKLTAELFKKDIFNYEESQDWQYKYNVPAIIDFYADWCGPCKMVAPILEELSDEYGDKLKIYKLDTEAEQELSSVFGIRSIPSILFDVRIPSLSLLLLLLLPLFSLLNS